MNDNNLHISYTDFVAKLARRMRVLREDLGLSQEKVAHGAWLAVFTYMKYERAESNPRTPMNPQLHTLLALADVFQVSLQELLDVDDLYENLYEQIYINAEKGMPLNPAPQELSMQFGERLQKLRWQHDLSKEDVAKIAGISLHAYHFLEKGESNPGTPANPRLKTLIGIAKAFEIELPELFDLQQTSITPKETAKDEEWLALV